MVIAVQLGKLYLKLGQDTPEVYQHNMLTVKESKNKKKQKYKVIKEQSRKVHF